MKYASCSGILSHKKLMEIGKNAFLSNTCSKRSACTESSQIVVVT